MDALDKMLKIVFNNLTLSSKQRLWWLLIDFPENKTRPREVA
jgi:hypothetical protein